jgi:hypothetical protein
MFSFLCIFIYKSIYKIYKSTYVQDVYKVGAVLSLSGDWQGTGLIYNTSYELVFKLLNDFHLNSSYSPFNLYLQVSFYLLSMESNSLNRTIMVRCLPSS